MLTEISGEKSVYNKIGIKIDCSEIKSINITIRNPFHYIYETIIIKKDIDLDEIKFNDDTCVQAKWVDLEELYNMIGNGEIAWVMISRIEDYIIPYMQ
jgi:isopentenyldiphosphate isomerase